MSDPLARFWVHDVQVERYLRRSAAGGTVVYDTPTTVRGWISDGSRLVAGPDGQQIASTAQVAFPAGTPFIPLDSRVMLPAAYGSRVLTVKATARGDGAGLPTPDHLSVALV